MDMNNLVHAFVISHLLRILVPPQLDAFISAWNHHPIPRSGIPIKAVDNRKNFLIPENLLPGSGYAINLYCSVRNSKFTPEHHFVDDLVSTHELRNNRDLQFANTIAKSGQENIIKNVINYNFVEFDNCFLQCVAIMDGLC
jgi:hypothetical protein